MYGGCRSANGGGWLESRALVGLGLISYSVYLIHEPLLRRMRAQSNYVENARVFLSEAGRAG